MVTQTVCEKRVCLSNVELYCQKVRISGGCAGYGDSLNHMFWEEANKGLPDIFSTGDDDVFPTAVEREGVLGMEWTDVYAREVDSRTNTRPRPLLRGPSYYVCPTLCPTFAID